MRAPLKIPVPPKPAIARPMISAIMFGAAPHKRDPSSNTNTANKVTCLAGKIDSHWAKARLKARSVMLREVAPVQGRVLTNTPITATYKKPRMTKV
jgi:hypothetical protein